MKCTLYQGGGGGEGRLTGGAQGPGKRFDCGKNCGEFLSLVVEVVVVETSFDVNVYIKHQKYK